MAPFDLLQVEISSQPLLAGGQRTFRVGDLQQVGEKGWFAIVFFHVCFCTVFFSVIVSILGSSSFSPWMQQLVLQAAFATI